jgi:2',3'-cyclic-nucleotide 2'-phosphodiesterase (5'-nucleotidase family)
MLSRRVLLKGMLLAVLATAGLAGEVEVTFYHTSDLHEHSAPLARIAGFVQAQRDTGKNIVFVDSGDWNNKGDLTELKLRGEPMAAIMGAMGYDAIIAGNHDYSFGASRMAELVDRYALPLVASNCTWPSAAPRNVKPYRLIEFDGVTVAVVGTATAIMSQATGDKLTVRPAVEAVGKVLTGLKGRADIIAVLVHQGQNEDKALIEALPRIDIVLAGHQHRRFATLNYDQARKTILQHSGANGDAIGEITVRWDGQAITRRSVRLVRVTNEMPEAEKVAVIRDRYTSRLPK